MIWPLGTAVLALAGGAGAAASAPDIGAAARALAPAGARVVLAQEIDATFGVVAFLRGGRGEALALRWADGRWRRAAPGAVEVRPFEPRPFSTIGRKPAAIAAHFSRGSRPLGGWMWLDGRLLRGTVAGGRGRASAEYYVLERPRPGLHEVVAYTSDGAHAAAAAWTFRVR